MKKSMIVMLLTITLAVQPLTVLGAGSSSGSVSSGIGRRKGSTSQGVTTVDMGSVLVVSDGLATIRTDGISVGVPGGTGSNEEIVQAALSTDGAALAGLPEQIAEMIRNIDSGMNLNTVTGMNEMIGYTALGKTVGIDLTDRITGNQATGQVPVSLYVPNLISSLQDVKMLCYENATGLWRLVTPESVDFEQKLITLYMNGSGTVTIVYRS